MQDIMETVTLKIKSPSAAISDLELNIEIQNTILDVKEGISRKYPTKPLPKAQKLVYLGKILKDTDKLEEVLRFEDDSTSFTFHLVCALPPQRTEASGEGLRYRPSLTQPMDNAQVPPAAQYQAPNNQNTMEEMMRTFSNQYSDAMTNLPSAASQADMAAMQEMYNQYLGLYMQYMGGQVPMPAQYQHLVAPPGPPVDQEVPQNAGVPQAAPQVQGPDAAMVMNAGGGGAVAEAGGDRNRDMLDWVYVMTRVMLLFSVIYFHSSFLRLAFVAGLGFLVFLYQNRQNARERGNQGAAVPPTPPAAVHPEEHQEEESEGQEEGREEQEEEEQPKPSKLAVMVTFITSLVSSIIPEQNRVV